MKIVGRADVLCATTQLHARFAPGRTITSFHFSNVAELVHNASEKHSGVSCLLVGLRTYLCIQVLC